MIDRVKNLSLRSKICTAEDAAALVKDGMIVGTSGFTAVGYPKAFPIALSKREDKPQITLITGASVGDEMDGSLARAGMVRRRYPYQTNKSMRDSINNGNINYVDIHLSQVPYWIKHGYFGEIDLAVIEAAEIDEDGNIIPTTCVGCSDTLVRYARQVIVEINSRIPESIRGIHDIYTGEPVPNTKPIAICHTADRIGTPYIPCCPEKIAAVIICDIPDSNTELKPPDETMQAIARNLISFLEFEVECCRLPKTLPPIQSGVGGVANAVLSCLAESQFTNLTVYTEVMQDAVIELIESGKVLYASATALTISPSKKEAVYAKLPKLKKKIILRSEEVSNSPEVIHRLGVIAMNTALEADLSGNVNSTHINGVSIMNGIGGSGDYARHAGLTIFTTASTAKDGKISCIVPQVSHVDHTEHDVMVLITEQGVADLRGLTAYERAESIINNCAHPDYRQSLRQYLGAAKNSSLPKHGLPKEDTMKRFKQEEI